MKHIFAVSFIVTFVSCQTLVIKSSSKGSNYLSRNIKQNAFLISSVRSSSSSMNLKNICQTGSWNQIKFDRNVKDTSLPFGADFLYGSLFVGPVGGIALASSYQLFFQSSFFWQGYSTEYICSR